MQKFRIVKQSILKMEENGNNYVYTRILGMYDKFSTEDLKEITYKATDPYYLNNKRLFGAVPEDVAKFTNQDVEVMKKMIDDIDLHDKIVMEEYSHLYKVNVSGVAPNRVAILLNFDIVPFSIMSDAYSSYDIDVLRKRIFK